MLWRCYANLSTHYPFRVHSETYCMWIPTWLLWLGIGYFSATGLEFLLRSAEPPEPSEKGPLTLTPSRKAEAPVDE